MTRLNLDWIGDPGNSLNTFKLAIILSTISFILPYIITLIKTAAIASDGITVTYWAYPFRAFQGLSFFYLLLVGIRTRMYIRKKYRIPSACCGDLEDCCCIFFCNCCAISQMARHTADYNTQSAACCTRTGLVYNLNYVDNDSTIAPSDGQSLVWLVIFAYVNRTKQRYNVRHVDCIPSLQFRYNLFNYLCHLIKFMGYYCNLSLFALKIFDNNNIEETNITCYKSISNCDTSKQIVLDYLPLHLSVSIILQSIEFVCGEQKMLNCENDVFTSRNILVSEKLFGVSV